MVASKSFASRRLRPIHAKNRSTTQRRRVNGEADLIGVLAHDLDRDQRCRGDLLLGISAVGEDALEERENAPRDSQKRSATIAVLDTRRMRFEREAAPVRVHECCRRRNKFRCSKILMVISESLITSSRKILRGSSEHLSSFSTGPTPRTMRRPYFFDDWSPLPNECRNRIAP